MTTVKGSSTGLETNIASLLCYICPPIISIIFIVIEKEDQDVKFHAWQGSAVGALLFGGLFAILFIQSILGMIASILGILISFFFPIFLIGWFILWVICLIKAYQGEKWRIPVIGDFAAKKAGMV